ncbi:hypothetical protein PsorP6_015039 [Peronosclerospora sorghi]|uniref:Uncharacterized protein n=1 Tax=Peronosclerospora sorghi TaxID=230839 RepID=A0ACC0VTW2_9STRA|nr:hypothetical protein PsorP6_015039 [Peronosclerospora sorghi]
MRPFHIVNGKGFRDYTQTVLNVGVNSKVGLRSEELLPVPLTIGRNVATRAAAGRATLAADLKVHLAKGVKISTTTDICTGDINKASFLSVTLHLVDNDFKLHHRTLACCPFPFPHTGSDVLEKFEGILHSFDATDTSLVTVGSDRGSNMHSADGIPSVYKKMGTML